MLSITGRLQVELPTVPSVVRDTRELNFLFSLADGDGFCVPMYAEEGG